MVNIEKIAAFESYDICDYSQHLSKSGEVQRIAVGIDFLGGGTQRPDIQAIIGHPRIVSKDGDPKLLFGVDAAFSTFTSKSGSNKRKAVLAGTAFFNTSKIGACEEFLEEESGTLLMITPADGNEWYAYSCPNVYYAFQRMVLNFMAIDVLLKAAKKTRVVRWKRSTEFASELLERLRDEPPRSHQCVIKAVKTAR